MENLNNFKISNRQEFYGNNPIDCLALFESAGYFNNSNCFDCGSLRQRSIKSRLKQKNLIIELGEMAKFLKFHQSQLYRSKYNVGRRLGTGWFFGGIERGDPSKIFLVQIPNRKAERLLPIIRDKILPETTIISDSWRAYNRIVTIGQ
ncbi:hypothetical protein RF11_09615 [Thelohanellus kitauei]|uniref:ISXO2-like transposase domain-containing protein n=1 Tax=Thelohanellus kitauei TaxID=669202 RepID=A0A0C2IK09_THEKT|nr:hypothetical protein RF11_09615 [Thelohanellus kitauei]